MAQVTGYTYSEALDPKLGCRVKIVYSAPDANGEPTYTVVIEERLNEGELLKKTRFAETGMYPDLFQQYAAYQILKQHICDGGVGHERT